MVTPGSIGFVDLIHAMKVLNFKIKRKISSLRFKCSVLDMVLVIFALELLTLEEHLRDIKLLSIPKFWVSSKQILIWNLRFFSSSELENRSVISIIEYERKFIRLNFPHLGLRVNKQFSVCSLHRFIRYTNYVDVK